ncbi:MAG: hypothetical protein ACI4DY_10205 [Monoglobaceae bacterium]
MFYVKEKLNDEVEIPIGINDENVYCRCPKCGAEVQVNLDEFFGDEDFGLLYSAVYCDECNAKYMEEKDNEHQHI